MSPSRTPDGVAPDLKQHLLALLPQHGRAALRDSVLPNLLGAVSDIGKALSAASEVAIVGTENAFGDEQLNVDLIAEGLVRKAISHSPNIRTASSEEDPRECSMQNEELEPDSEKYTVAFDPLDGSSIIGPNWSVGAIFGIWDGETALNQPSEKQVASILGVFGPRTLAIVALRFPGLSPACFEVGFNEGGTIKILRPQVQLSTPPFKTRYFAPANLRGASESEKYMGLILAFIHEKYTLRYAGGLVPDLYHALVKGHGVYISPITASSKAKLRRLYELYPVALVMECAGGQAIDPEDGRRILDIPVKGCDDRGGLVCGTGEEVEKVRAALLG